MILLLEDGVRLNMQVRTWSARTNLNDDTRDEKIAAISCGEGRDDLIIAKMLDRHWPIPPATAGPLVWCQCRSSVLKRDILQTNSYSLFGIPYTK